MISLDKVFTRFLPAAILTISLLLAVSVSANPANEIDISYAGGTLWGTVNDIAVSGNYVYYTNGFEFFVVDVTDPSAPLTAGHVAIAKGREVAIYNQYAYVTTWSEGLKIVDISNPENPVLVQTPFALESERKILISGSYIYTATDSLRVYDLNNPVRPVLVANGGPVCKASELLVVGELLYLAAENCGVYIFDISDPLTPLQVAHYSDLIISAVDIDVIGSYMYIVDGNGPPRSFAMNPASLLIIDISDISNPEFVKIGNGYRLMSVTHDGNYAYISEEWTMNVYDISDPANPRAVGSTSYVGSHNLVVSDGYIFAASYIYGMRIIDVQTPSNPVVIGNTDIISSPLIVSVSGNRAVVEQSGYSNTSYTPYYILTFLDISNPYLPVVTGSMDSPTWYTAIELRNDMLYLTDNSVGLKILDISDPQYPTQLGVYPISGGARDVTILGSYAIVAAGDNGLLIINISDPASLTLTGSFKTSGFATTLDVSGGRAYIAQSDSTLEIVDITDLKSPKFCSNIRLPYGVYRPVVSGDLVMVNATKRTWSSKSRMTFFIDVSDPYNPDYGDFQPLDGYVIDKHENFLFVTKDWGSRIQILDLTDKMDIRVIGESSLGAGTNGAEYSNGFLYLASDLGFVVLKTSLLPTGIVDAPFHILPQSFSLSQNYPNPFNPSTTIEFDLPTKSMVRLEIFNLLGREVITLVDEQMSAGHKAVEWNGRDSFGNQLSSGLYFYRLEADGFMQSKKMILLK